MLCMMLSRVEILEFLSLQLVGYGIASCSRFFFFFVLVVVVTLRILECNGYIYADTNRLCHLSYRHGKRTLFRDQLLLLVASSVYTFNF